jgi:acetyl-CoA synthetase
MNRGYHLPRPDRGATDPWAGFEWRIGETYNIGAVALASAETDPAATALRHLPLDEPPTRLSYGELKEATDAVAAGLRDRGVERGDRVAVCLPQCPELLLAHLAIFELGAVSVPLSMLLGADSFRYSLDDSETTLAVVDAVRAGEVGPLDVETLSVDPGGYADSPLGGFRDAVHRGATVEPVSTAPDDPALVLYTSGTTGKPKGVVQGHSYLAGGLPGYQAWFELFDDAAARSARVWTPAEWAWAGALFDVVFPALATGGTLVSRERRSGFDPTGALSLVAAESVTHTFMPATALQRIRGEADPAAHDLDALAVVMSGGESLPRSLLVWARDELAPRVHETYGQTEANALVGNCTAAYEVRPGSMGRVYPGHDVVVVDEDGSEVETGETGEIAVRLPDPVVFERYWGDEAATAEKFDGGRFLTGDLGMVDDDGYFWHRGRADDLILTSGYRVSPLEVEAALQAHPDVAAAVVGGAPDPERGERVRAYVVVADDASANDALAETLRDRVRSTLGGYKVPRDIEFLDALPETRSGKADRSALFE